MFSQKDSDLEIKFADREKLIGKCVEQSNEFKLLMVIYLFM